MLGRTKRYYYLVRSSFFGHINKGWRFALKTDEAARLYNCIGEVEQNRKILAKAEAKWLLTYNDHPRIRELYKGFKISTVVTRLNTDKTATANRRPFRQLIIRNY